MSPKSELELYLAIFKLSPKKMVNDSIIMVESTKDDKEWSDDDSTAYQIYTYIMTHSKVDGKDWSCGEFGSRWADTIINGRQCILSFYSKKFNPDQFMDTDKKYKIIITPEQSKKQAKRTRIAEEFDEIEKKAIKRENGHTIVNGAEMKKLLHKAIEGRRKSKGETMFFYHRKAQDINWATNDEIHQQAKIWKKQMKDGVSITILKHNCQTKLINGEEWYILVLSEDGSPIDPTGMGIDDSSFIVNGLIYWFKHKASRDTIFEWLTK